MESESMYRSKPSLQSSEEKQLWFNTIYLEAKKYAFNTISPNT